MRLAARMLSVTLTFLVVGGPTSVAAAELKPQALTAWETYVRLTEARIRKDLERETSERPGNEVTVRKLSTKDERGRDIEPDDAMIHHWKGSVFMPAVRLEQVDKFVRDYDRHERFFKEVERSRLVRREGDTFRIFYRLKRKKLITVVYNTEHTVVYARQGPGNQSSRSVATKIAQLKNAGSADERELAAGQDDGFMWRLNSYWRFTERDGGVVVECESISLSRSIPFGLAWAIKDYVESVPQESLINTLTSLRDGVRASAGAGKP